MNTIFYKATTTLCFLLIINISKAQSSGTLVINAFNFSNDQGKAVVHLFREQDDIPGKPFAKSSADIIGGKTVITFQNVAYGKYAAILFHDKNANETLDHKWGFPNEPMGFSNSWRLSLFSGMPSFEKLKFEFSVHNKMCTIKIK